MLWQKCRALRKRPSELVSIGMSEYVAYCFDEAVVFFGLQLENMLEEASETGKPSKEQQQAERARQQVLDSVFGPSKTAGSGYADPAAMFQ
jgi:hypothetical protein